MTTGETQADNPEEAIVEAPEPLLFSINFARLAELKRSAVMLLAARRVPTGKLIFVQTDHYISLRVFNKEISF